MKQFKRLLNPLRKKIFLERGINSALTALAVAIMLIAALVIASKFIYVENMPFISATLIAASVAVGFARALWNRPSYAQAAAAGDALGYKERFVTAYELFEKNSGDPVSVLMKEDAVARAKSANFAKNYKIKVERRWITIVGILIALTFMTAFLPGLGKEEITRRQNAKEKIESEIKRIEAEKKETISQLTEKDGMELNAEIKKLVKEMRKAKTEGEAVKAIQKSQEELKKLSQNSVSKDMKALGEKLSAHPATQRLGENLKKGDVEEIARDMERVNEFLQNASEEELKKLSEVLSQAAAELTNNPELAQALQQASDNMASGQNADVTNAMSNLNDTINQLASQNSEFRQAVEKLNSATAQAGQNLRQNSGSDDKKSAANQDDSTEDQSGDGNGEEGKTTRPGDGGQQGGQSGSGQQSGGQQTGGSDRGRGHVENESIFKREASDFAEYDAQVEGEETDGPSLQKEQKNMGTPGESVPYEKVIGQYRDEALSTLDDSQIPHGMRELVKEYFSSLE